jgi:RHS repeat-associated protein
VGRVGRDGSRAHWLGDQVGTVGVVLEDTGAAAETVVRDAWGNLLAGSSSERYGFAQREHDSESDLVYMRYRMYDPRAGRFTQPDPLRFNRPFKNYLYARNDPLSFTDPLGLDDTPESKARMLRHFALWYGEAGLVLLEAFRESGGTRTLKNMWWGKSSVGIRHITIDMDDEGEAMDYLMDALVKAIGQLGVEQKLKVAAALGLESTAQLNLATVKSIAQETRKVLDTA